MIEALSAGFRFLSWRLELILIPVLLDVMLWLGPRFSIAPLFAEFASLYRGMAGVETVTPEMAQMVDQMAGMIDEMGRTTNLAGGLVSSTLLHVPSLFVVGAPTVDVSAVTIGTAGEAFVWWLIFSVLGVLIGVVYMGLLARQLPIGAMSHKDWRGFVAASFRHWLQVIGFVIILALGLLLLYLPISLLVAMLMLVSPEIGSTVATMAGGLTLAVLIFFYFVTPAIVMDNTPVREAMMSSLRLVRENFWATLGLILLTSFISLGVGLLLIQLAGLSNIGAAIAVVINAYIGTGLTMALLVFYRTRFIREKEL